MKKAGKASCFEAEALPGLGKVGLWVPKGDRRICR